jgi:hypothetical protein
MQNECIYRIHMSLNSAKKTKATKVEYVEKGYYNNDMRCMPQTR